MHDQSPIENLQKYLENVLNENVNSMAQNSERESPEEQSLPGDLKGQEKGLGGDAIDPQNGESDLKNSQNDLESQSESSQNNNTIDPAQSDALKPWVQFFVCRLFLKNFNSIILSLSFKFGKPNSFKPFEILQKKEAFNTFKSYLYFPYDFL